MNFSTKRKLPWISRKVPHAIGIRCTKCGKPILLVLHAITSRRVPIESASWDGSIFYIKGKHAYHGLKCPWWKRWVAIDPETEI